MAQNWNLDIDKHLNRFVPRSFLHIFPRQVSYFLGHRDASHQDQEVGSLIIAFWALVGAFAGVVAIEATFQIPAIQAHHPPLLIASFVGQICKLDLFNKFPLNKTGRVQQQFLSSTPSQVLLLSRGTVFLAI